jgi:hypothetical protein
MMRARRQGLWRRDAALIVALFLVVQALVSGFATGARAAAPVLPADVICGTLSPDRATGAQAGLVHLLDCCTLGCPMVGAAAPSPAHPPLARSLPVILVAAQPVAIGGSGPRFELAPVLSRAPPVA